MRRVGAYSLYIWGKIPQIYPENSASNQVVLNRLHTHICRLAFLSFAGESGSHRWLKGHFLARYPPAVTGCSLDLASSFSSCRHEHCRHCSYQPYISLLINISPLHRGQLLNLHIICITAFTQTNTSSARPIIDGGTALVCDYCLIIIDQCATGGPDSAVI